MTEPELTPGMAKRIQMVATGDLVPYAGNARTHDDNQIAKIAASIAEFGFNNPILVDTSHGTIIAGHGRLAAANLLGLKEVPVIKLDHLNDKQRRAYILADNKLAEMSDWDEEMLQAEIEDLNNDGFDIELTGFEKSDFAVIFPDDVIAPGDGDGTSQDPDAVPPEPEKYVTETGDIWNMDGHRLMCGDATSQENIDTLMAGELADLVITDPPYNVNYSGAAGRIMNDDMCSEDFLNFLTDSYVNMFQAMKDGASIYVAHSETEGYIFRRAFLDAGFKLQSCLIWKKNHFVLGRADYQWIHEPILYGWKPTGPHNWYGNRKNVSVHDMPDESPFHQLEDGTWSIQMGDRTLLLQGDDIKISEAAPTIINEPKPNKSDIHPTMKPVALLERFLLNSSKVLDNILDPFGGGGSTLIAAERNERYAKLMELDPKYCDVIVRRWEQYTGKKAALEGSGKSFDEVCADRIGEII